MLLTEADVRLTWNIVDDVRNALAFPYMVNAFRAGTIVAIVAAGIGWFVVLRRETFAGHTLSVVGFPGGAGAIWLGFSAIWGYFAFCVGAALVIGSISRSRGRGYHEESAAIGTLQAFALACGFLFARLYGGLASGFSALLFGSFTGVTDAQVVTLLVMGLFVALVVGAIARPLLFASIDPDVADARGVPVRVLSFVFLVVLGIAVAEASQITGSLLVFALLVVPAATAQAVTARPVLGLCVAIAVGLAITWLGLGVGFYSSYPIGFWITTIAFAGYLVAHLARAAQKRANPRAGRAVRGGRVSVGFVAVAAGTGFSDMLAHPFMRHAFVAGTAIAAASALVGYFVVLRSQVFSSDALSHAAFTGALGALAFGVDLRLGLFVVTGAVALGMGLLGPRGRADDVVIGTVFTWVLGLGVLFQTLFTTSSRSSGNGSASVNVLFGSILGLSAGQTTLAAIVGVVACIAVVAVGRPLLFASVDEAVAAARGVPVRALGIGFLVLVGVAAAEATQAVGALLLVGLVAAPAAAAQRLTDRPWRGLALAAALAVFAVWSGLTVSYLFATVPPSFAIMAVATAELLGAVGVSTL